MSGQIGSCFVHRHAGRSQMISHPRTRLLIFLGVLIMAAPTALSQTESATVSGRVTDASGSVVPGTEVQLKSIERGTSQQAVSNQAGIYSFPSVQPGQYHMTLRKAGFRQIEFVGLIVNVQDHLEKNFQLQVGSVSESVTVAGGGPLVNTEDASVSTVVDRNFAENLPLNGRSFQTLIQLTPGVVPAASNLSDGGQFNINGQRANANYWMVDGVSANIGIAPYSATGNSISGSLGSFSALGGTNSLVSIDAMQEFRLQTSTYAPEFGRTPGGQISIITRSGTNRFHGTAFDYLRNDLFDANDWFADNANLPKPEERQNDFGGTFSGPIWKNRTFFFFSYEGLRLRLPQTGLTTVPDLTARQNADPVQQPYLNAFSLPNGADDTTAQIAAFDASFSNPAALDAYSLRVDHLIKDRVTVSARYNYSPSNAIQRGGSSEPLSNLFTSRINTQTATGSVTWLISPVVANDLRLNYSTVYSSSYWSLDGFGGAVPLSSLNFPSPYTTDNAHLTYTVLPLKHRQYADGDASQNRQRQFNIVDNISVQKGLHSIKVGVDYRRLAPLYSPSLYSQNVFFSSLASAETGNVDLFNLLVSSVDARFLFRNLSAFGQDTWRLRPKLTLTYGLRWDVDFVPATTSGPSIPAVTGYDLKNLSNLALLPNGSSPFKTTYNNFAPRLGIAYQISTSRDWQTAVRGGAGVFYDLRDGEFGNLLGEAYPFTAVGVLVGAGFPVPSSLAAPPPISTSSLPTGLLTAFDPGLKLPYTLEWNLSLEQALAGQRTVTASYLGARGKRLIQSAVAVAPNQNFGFAELVGNTANSDYDALQVQFKQRAWHGLQTLASYTWSHSIDTSSGGSILGDPGNTLLPGLPSMNRGPSDFDVRHAITVGATYDVPKTHFGRLANVVLNGWSIQNAIQGHSASPVNVFDGTFTSLYAFGASVRPDIVPNQPFYVHGNACPDLAGSVCPGGKALNPAAFLSPPSDPNSGFPLRQGNLARNALRGFGAIQWDLAVHREFPISEVSKLQFRAEMFNVINHPNFAPPQADISASNFGESSQLLNQYLGSNVGNGGFSPLYQIGGPRSIQLALK